MATDAQISQIEVLSSFAVNLANFSESVVGNSKAFVTLITEKLSELRLAERSAKEKCKQISQEREKLFMEYSRIAGGDNNEYRRQLLVAVKDAEHRERIAKRCCATIRQNVLVAHGAVIVMIDCAKQFSRDASNNAEKGISFLKQSGANLEQYKLNQSKI